jgi:hypothetical protein
MSASQLFVLLYMEVRSCAKCLKSLILLLQVSKSFSRAMDWMGVSVEVCCLVRFIHRVSLASPLDLSCHSDYDEAGEPECHIC